MLKIAFPLLLALSLASVKSHAFEVNGLHTGLSIEQLKKKLPSLKCVQEGDAQICRADRLSGTYRTLARHRVASITAKADSHRIVQAITINLTCGVTTKRVAASFVSQFGKTQTIDSLNNRFIWGDEAGEMVLQPTNGTGNVCHGAELTSSGATSAGQRAAE